MHERTPVQVNKKKAQTTFFAHVFTSRHGTIDVQCLDASKMGTIPFNSMKSAELEAHFYMKNKWVISQSASLLHNLAKKQIVFVGYAFLQISTFRKLCIYCVNFSQKLLLHN